MKEGPKYHTEMVWNDNKNRTTLFPADLIKKWEQEVPEENVIKTPCGTIYKNEALDNETVFIAGTDPVYPGGDITIVGMTGSGMFVYDGQAPDFESAVKELSQYYKNVKRWPEDQE